MYYSDIFSPNSREAKSYELGNSPELTEGWVWPSCREGQASLPVGCWVAGGVVEIAGPELATAGGLGVGFLLTHTTTKSKLMHMTASMYFNNFCSDSDNVTSIFWPILSSPFYYVGMIDVTYTFNVSTFCFSVLYRLQSHLFHNIYQAL